MRNIWELCLKLTDFLFSDEIINPWTGGKFNLHGEEHDDNSAQDGKSFLETIFASGTAMSNTLIYVLGSE